MEKYACFFFQAEDGIRDYKVTGVQTCALPIGALSFWTVESLEAANVLSYGSVEAAQYPLALYAQWFRRLLTFAVPLACVAYYPALAVLGKPDPLGRSEERRVGKECRSRWSPYH